MKYTYIPLTIFFLLALPNTTLLTKEEQITQITNSQTDIYDQKSNNLNIGYSDQDDELDNLLEAAINQGIIGDHTTFRKPSKFEVILRKYGMILVVNPYIYTVTKYRAFKKWLTKNIKSLCIWRKQKKQ